MPLQHFLLNAWSCGIRDLHHHGISSLGVCIDPNQYIKLQRDILRRGKDRMIWVHMSGRFDVHDSLPLVVHAVQKIGSV